MIPPKLDSLGRVTEHPIDTWEPRSGVALALKELAPFLEPKTVSILASFFVTTGLGDRKPEVSFMQSILRALLFRNNPVN